MSQKVRSVWLGISIGTLVSILFGLVYLVVLHEPGPAFYLFTGLVFVVGPLVVSAAMDGDTLYLYNDKIGYFIDARTGELENDFLTIDNYGGLSRSENPIMSSPTSSGHWYMETSAVITSWRVDGSVKSRRYLSFNAIALGCFIYGDGRNVAVLK